MSKQILAATSIEKASEPFLVRDDTPQSITASGLGAGETVHLQFFDGDDWRDYYEDGSIMQVTDTNSMLSVYAIGKWRAYKSVTVAAVSVKLHGNPLLDR